MNINKRALLGYFMLAVLFTWPVVLHLSTHVFGPGPGDNLEYAWKLWFVADALQRGASPFFAPTLNYPEGYSLAYGEITPVHTFLLAPLTLLVGPVATYNLAMLASLALSGWFVYLLARRWLPGAPALIPFMAGATFTFSAYHMARVAGGHLNLAPAQWLVVALYGVDTWIEHRRIRDAALIGLGVALAALSSWYYGFIAVLILPVYALARGEGVRALLGAQRTWASAGMAMLVVGLLCGPFLLPYLQIVDGGAATVSTHDAIFWSASPLDYFVPNPHHPLWGNAIQSLVWPIPDSEMPYEFLHTIDYVTLGLVLVAWRRVSGGRWRALKWAVVMALVLSFGPELKLGRLPLGIPLPAALLHMALPMVRSWGRFSVFVALGASLLAAAGLWYVLRGRSPRQRRALATVVLIIILLTAWNGPMQLVDAGPRPVDRWLAAQPGDDPVMQFPLGVALSGPSLWYTRYHGKPITFGYGTYYEHHYRGQYPELAVFPDHEALDRLAGWGVRWVLVDGTLKAQVDTQPRLQRVLAMGDQVIYTWARLTTRVE